jgi:hypothetical protein
MSDERPLCLKRKARSEALNDVCKLMCIVHYCRCTESEIHPLSESQMSNIRVAAVKRQSQINPDIRLDDLCMSLPTDFDS